MSDYMFKVLWIDDEHEQMEMFKLKAKRYNIQLEAKKSKKEALKELEENHHSYDVLLLDAKIIENNNDVNEPDTRHSVEIINYHKEKNLGMPLFVRTGNIDKQSDKNYYYFVNEDNVFEKGEDEKLFNKIIEEVDGDNYKIRKNNEKLFSLLNENDLPNSTKKNFLELFKKNNLELNQELNKIRQLIEDLFLFLNKKNIIPREVAFDNYENLKLTLCSKFLCGREVDIYGNKFKIPEKYELNDVPKSMLQGVLFQTQSRSHTSSFKDYPKNVYTLNIGMAVFLQVIDLYIYILDYILEK